MWPPGHLPACLEPVQSWSSLDALCGSRTWWYILSGTRVRYEVKISLHITSSDLLCANSYFRPCVLASYFAHDCLHYTTVYTLKTLFCQQLSDVLPKLPTTQSSLPSLANPPSGVPARWTIYSHIHPRALPFHLIRCRFHSLPLPSSTFIKIFA
ncbi:hypothetical protein MPTK1_3g05450 [Marchantia polymorpha subsp. ruderalis]|uniref:Uncharacterized protein n=2 Tax=Marchantia polymorpha TaxID=3197 RepID=A0AAF6AXP6_MARPO|nr:hypothetical protein MARPO_0006s0018 [Marchantia polymorpha]BBN04530.1 hypothetical protein Mp_3g05450 [Marchantia polymorpha subsp. ruderalis]|eukprot:PTQ47967.1 hypothetical protein MARPO_0006s0018 [Marchantia polymorpha]